MSHPALDLAAIRRGEVKDLRYADLTGANLTGANLTRANLTRANLGGADLTRANLGEANLPGANLTRANLTEANLTRANLTEANLTRANLTEANLTGAYLTRANLTWANLTWANLTHVNLADVNLSMSRGIDWSQAGPIGTDRRTLTGVVIDNEIRLFAGCHQGTPEDFRSLIEQGGDSDWRWPDDFSHLQQEAMQVLGVIETQLQPKLDAQPTETRNS